MKPKKTLRNLLSIASSSLLTVSSASAQLTWDANDVVGGQTDGAGGWLDANHWWDGLNNVNWVSGSNAVFGNGGTAGNVTLASPTAVGSLTFNSFSGTYNLGTSGQALTINSGLTMSAGSGAVTFSSPVTLGGTQTWTNNSAQSLSWGSLNLGTGTLTFSGTGNFSSTAGTIAATAGSIIHNGSGLVSLPRAGGSLAYTGTTSISGGGTLMIDDSKPTGNFNISNGMLTDYYQTTHAFTSGLGDGNNQIQIYGDSGFGGGNGTSTWRIGASNSVLKWGTLAEGGTGFFNPTSLKFLAPGADNMTTGGIHGLVSLNNGLDLNGAVRTINVQTTSGTPLSSTATVTGTIVNTNGVTVGGLTKTGAGNLILSNTGNTYNGATTITEGALSAAGTGSLGNSSATNTLIFNGGTLRATGTITSVATRGVTLTSTGTIDTNNQLVSIAGDMTGAGGLIKNGANTLTLSGTNNYGGVTTVNAGTLAITKETSLYNATPASWTAANLNVKSGATLALNVDSAGTAGFTSGNLNTLLTNISVANTAAQGLQAGATLGLDTSTATGATFTPDAAITNSTGAFGGVINLNKLGAGTLVLDKANTYSGFTLISAGTLQLSASGVILGPIINNGTLLVDKAAIVGTDFPAFPALGGSGSITANTGATITINTPTALQNMALNTTGGGSFILSGVTTPTFGGLSGATGDLATIITGYSGVTNLTLNVLSGSLTYGGVIADGAAGMTLTKNGAGTQILSGNNTYTGATIVNSGTLTVGSVANGSLSSSSALHMGGNGVFNYSRTGTGQTVNGLTVNGGGSFVNNTVSGQTLTLGAITRTASEYGTVNFTTLTGPISTTTGNAGTTGMIGAWATTGSAGTLRYAIGSADDVTPTNITALTGTTATAGTLANVTDANGNFEFSAAATTTADLTGNTLRFSTSTNSAFVLNIGATNTLTLNGLMNAATNGGLTIQGGPGTGGIIIGSTNELVISNASRNTNIVSVIANGASPGRVVVGGGANLTLTSANTFSGGLFLNGGTVNVNGTTDSLGAAGSTITVYANSTLVQGGSGAVILDKSIVLDGSAVLTWTHGNNFWTVLGPVTGTGGLKVNDSGGVYTRTLNLRSTSNTFTGLIDLSFNNSAIAVNSLGDASGAGNIVFAGNNAGFKFGAAVSGPSSSLVLDHRKIEFTAAGNSAIITNDAATARTFTINTDLLVTGVTSGTKNLQLEGTNIGNNAFNGIIANGGLATLNLTKAGAGKWILGNAANSYTGATTVSGGTLEVTKLANGLSNSSLGASSNAAGNLLLANGTTLRYTGTGDSSDRSFTINVATAAHGATLDASGTSGALNLTNSATPGYGTANQTRTLNLRGTNTGANTLAATIANNGSGAVSITKSDAGTWVLSGSNSYTGTTTINTGTLLINGNQSSATGLVDVRTGSVLGGTGTIGGNVTIENTSGLTFNLSTAPGSHDKLDVAGTFTFEVGSHPLTITSSGGATTGLYTLVTSVGTMSGPLPTATLPVGWTADEPEIVGNDLVINITSTGSGDATPPTLVSITDNVSGGPVNIGATVTYTVTFDEDMDDTTVAAADFGNNGTAAASIGAVTETSPGVFSVPVTVTGPGSLVLRINDGAILKDLAGNDLDTTPALLDDTTITVRNAYQTWALTNAISSAPGQDKDGDGVNNAIEFVLGGTVGGNDLDKLPEVTMTATDMIITFERQRSSIDGVTGLEIEVGTTLTGWPNSYTVGTTTLNSDSGVTVLENSPTGFDTITVTVPKGTDPNKFARLSVDVTE